MFKNKPCAIDQACSACLLGWLILTYREVKEFDKAHNKLKERIGFIPGWNDNPGRTQEEVRELCKELDI